MHEAGESRLFTSAEQKFAKLFFEGDELPIEVKWEHPVQMFENTFSILASNFLPWCIRIDPKKPKNESE